MFCGARALVGQYERYGTLSLLAGIDLLKPPPKGGGRREYQIEG